MEKKKTANPAKEYLRRYRAILHRQNSLIRALASLRDRQTNCTVRLKAIQVQSSGYVSDRMADNAAAAIELEDQIMEAEAKAARALSDILRAIEAVKDETQRAVLTLRYIEVLDWLKVADGIGYEIANTYIIHGKALIEVNRWIVENNLCTNL